MAVNYNCNHFVVPSCVFVYIELTNYNQVESVLFIQPAIADHESVSRCLTICTAHENLRIRKNSLQKSFNRKEIMEDTSGRATEEDMELEGDKARTVCIHHQTSGMRQRPSGRRSWADGPAHGSKEEGEEVHVIVGNKQRRLEG